MPIPVKASGEGTILITQVNVPERLLVLSERAAYMADLSRTLKRGDVVQGTVQKLTDYGAFVSITAADGNQHGTDVRLVQLYAANTPCTGRLPCDG